MKILTSLRGRYLGLAPDRELIASRGIQSGEHGKHIILPSDRHVSLFDDFLGDVVADSWNYTEGTDTATADGAINADVNGVFRLTGGDSAGTVAADGAQLNSELNWKANQGGLWFAARVSLAEITSVSCFVGLTDTKSLEAPIESAASADTLTTNATDAAGWMFDTSMATDNWWMTGVANDVDATAQNLGSAPVADTYEELAIEIDTSGNAYFYHNGLPVGSAMSGAVTATVALTPVFIIWPRSAAAGKTMDIDWVNVAALRA